MLDALLMLVELQVLPDNQQHHLTQSAFAKSVESCTIAVKQSPQWCGCVVRGFETFMTEADWWRALHDEKIKDSATVIQIEQACKRATAPRE